MLEADLADSQALTKQLALVFDFVLRFDDLKARRGAHHYHRHKLRNTNSGIHR